MAIIHYRRKEDLMVFKSILNSGTEYIDTNEFAEIYLRDSDNKKVCTTLLKANDKKGTYILKRDIAHYSDHVASFLSSPNATVPSATDSMFIWSVDIVEIPKDIPDKELINYVSLDVENNYAENAYSKSGKKDIGGYRALVFPFSNENGVENLSDIVTRLQSESKLNINNPAIRKYISEILNAVERLNGYGFIFNEFHVSKYHPSRFYFRKNGSIIVDFSPLTYNKEVRDYKANRFDLSFYNKKFSDHNKYESNVYPLEFADPVITKYEILGTKKPIELAGLKAATSFEGLDINSQNYSLAAFLFFLMYGQMPYWGYLLSGQRDNDISSHYYIYRDLYLRSPAFIFDKEDHIDNDIADYGYEEQVQRIWDESPEAVKKAFSKVLNFHNALRLVAPDNLSPKAWMELLDNKSEENVGKEKTENDSKTVLKSDSVFVGTTKEKDTKETIDTIKSKMIDMDAGDIISPQNKPTKTQVDKLISEGKALFESEKYEEALKYFLGADECGSLEGSEWLACTYLKLKEYEKAEALMIRCAEKGKKWSLKELAEKYRDENSPLYNLDKSVVYTRKLAEQGNCNSMQWMGYFFENGKGVEEDKEQAAEWYKKSLTGKREDDKYPLEHLKNIGAYFFKESDEKNKYQKAVACLEKVAEINDDDDAMLLIGKCYYYGGYGIKPNDEIAAAWFAKAAASGNAEAKKKLEKLRSKMIVETKEEHLDDVKNTEEKKEVLVSDKAGEVKAENEQDNLELKHESDKAIEKISKKAVSSEMKQEEDSDSYINTTIGIDPEGLYLKEVFDKLDKPHSFSPKK